MMLQSHSGVIALLPSLPSEWHDGHFRGLRARGGVEVDAAWKDGRATSALLRSSVAGEFKIRPPHGQQITGIQSAGRTIAYTEQDGVWTLQLEPRNEYTIAF
jgi:alpha-L-fucosidase 2